MNYVEIKNIIFKNRYISLTYIKLCGNVWVNQRGNRSKVIWKEVIPMWRIYYR